MKMTSLHMFFAVLENCKGQNFVPVFFPSVERYLNCIACLFVYLFVCLLCVCVCGGGGGGG